jgi:hypothetical protein
VFRTTGLDIWSGNFIHTHRRAHETIQQILVFIPVDNKSELPPCSLSALDKGFQLHASARTRTQGENEPCTVALLRALVAAKYAGLGFLFESHRRAAPYPGRTPGIQECYEAFVRHGRTDRGGIAQTSSEVSQVVRPTQRAELMQAFTTVAQSVACCARLAELAGLGIL